MKRPSVCCQMLSSIQVVSFTATITSSGDCFRWQVASGVSAWKSKGGLNGLLGKQPRIRQGLAKGYLSPSVRLVASVEFAVV